MTLSVLSRKKNVEEEVYRCKIGKRKCGYIHLIRIKNKERKTDLCSVGPLQSEERWCYRYNPSTLYNINFARSMYLQKFGKEVIRNLE